MGPLEAGTHSHWVSRRRRTSGYEAIVANPRMLRFIYGSDTKNDSADAAYLARVESVQSRSFGPSCTAAKRARPTGRFCAAGKPWSAAGPTDHPRPGDGQGLRGQAPSLLD